MRVSLVHVIAHHEAGRLYLPFLIQVSGNVMQMIPLRLEVITPSALLLKYILTTVGHYVIGFSLRQHVFVAKSCSLTTLGLALQLSPQHDSVLSLVRWVKQ